MSQENVEIVRAVYERWGEGDFSASVDLFDPHIVLVLRPEFPDAGTYLGVDAVVAYTRGLLESWTHFTIDAKDLLAAGDSVLVGVHQRGVGTNSGIPTELHYFMLWSFRGDKVIRLESVREHAAAREAAGLAESNR